jgi:PhoH-like ATPase
VDKSILIDTNLYLDDAQIIHKLAKAYCKVLFPLTVLKELDQKKYNKDFAYSARNAIREILEFMNNKKDQMIVDVERYPECSTPDEKILASALKHNAVIATKDVSMSISAKAQGLESILHDMILNNIYKPYIHLHMDNIPDFIYRSEYLNEDYKDVLCVLSRAVGQELCSDYWWFIIIDMGNNKPIIYANNPILYELVRIDNMSKYREIRTESATMVKARDVYQICALYAMIEAPNILICGSYGSGKSLLSSAYAIAYNTDRKIFVSRPNLTVDRRFELGFLPGTLEDKLGPWMAGFMSSLYYMFSNTKGQKAPNGVTYDFVKEQIFKRYFEMTPLDSLQGMSFMDGDLLLLDEVQLCSISILSIVLSRFGEGSKLIMTGDVKQTYGIIPPSENGLLKLLRLMPNKYLAYVELKNNYRSELIEIANELQNKEF